MQRTSFGMRLRKLRQKHGKTMGEVAKAIGTSVVYVSDVERDRRPPPRMSLLEKWLKCLGEEQELQKLSDLAAKLRKRIAIRVPPNSPQMSQMLFALQRRCEEGTLTAQEIQEILRILYEQGDRNGSS